MRFRKLVPLSLLFILTLSACGQSNSEPSNSTFPGKFKKLATNLQIEQPNFDLSGISQKYSAINIQGCQSQMDPNNCFISKLVETLDENYLATEQTFQSLKQLPENYCNQVSSSFGAYIASKGKDNLKIIESDPKFCGDSFSQGFIFYSLEKLGTDNRKISHFCDDLVKDSKWNCSIYLGQYFLNQNLADPVAMTKSCYLIPSPDDTKGNHMTFRRACLSGLWQRFFNNQSVIKLLTDMKPKATDIFSFCLASERSAKEVCLQEDSHPFWKLPSFKDVNQKFKACRDLNDPDLTDQCNFGMGRGVADNINRAPNKLYPACSALVLPFDYEYCMIAAGEALNRDDFKNSAESLCQDLSMKCLLGIGAATYGMHAGDEKAALEACSTYYKDLESLTLCEIGVFRGFSRLSYVHSHLKVADEVYARCDAIAGSHARNCLLGAFAGTQNFLSDIGGEAGIINYCSTSKFQELCASSGASIYTFESIPTTGKTCLYQNKEVSISCASWLGLYAESFKQETLCQPLDKALQSYCKDPDSKYILKEYVF